MASAKAKAWVAIAVAAVGGFEGLRQHAYADPVGIPTICFGETRGVQLGDHKTVEECKDLLAASLEEADQTLRRCAGEDLVADMPPKTRAAYNSFIFNVGPGGKGRKDGFCQLKNGNAPTMLKMLRNGNWEGSCWEFKNWANPAWLRGLTIRRAAEQQLCLEGVKEWRAKPESSD
jgi:lysozyme